MLVRGQTDVGEWTTLEERAAGGRQIGDEALLLPELPAKLGIGRGSDRRLVVVAVDGRRLPARQEDAGALAEQGADTSRVGGAAAAHEQQLGDVTLGERPLPGSDLDDGGSVLRASSRPDRDRGGCGRDEGESEEDRDDRPARAWRERTKRGRPAGPHRTTTTVCMPPM